MKFSDNKNIDENGESIYTNVQTMLLSALAEASEYLENYMCQNTMHRQRVKTPDGYKWVQGRTHDELNDNIIRAYIASGRIAEFINVAPEKMALPETNFRDYAERWFTMYKTGLKQMSQVDYRYQLEHILYPVFGDRVLQSITLEDVQRFLNDHRHVAKSTLQKSLLVLNQLFKLAVKEHIAEENPIDTKMLKITSEETEAREPLTGEEFSDVLAHVGDLKFESDRAFLALLLLTGMRRGEVLGLQWGDIDFEKKTITVQRNVTHPDNAAVIGTPKSKKGIRTIPLDDRLRQWLSPRENEEFIIGGRNPITRSSFTKMWGRIKKQVNVHGASPHIFRHTYATMLKNAGVAMKTIQSIMGHADIGTTMNIYAHTDAANILDAGLKFAELTKESGSPKPCAVPAQAS